MNRSATSTDLDLKTRFIPGQVELTSTTFRKRRAKSIGQHTLNTTNVSQRSLHSIRHIGKDEPPRKCVHPPNPPSTTYKINNSPPDRVYLTVQRTPYGGETLVPDEYNDWWEKGEYWNRDSNIRVRPYAQIQRCAAQGAHDVHRHDQINHERLAADRENTVDLFKTWIPPRFTDKYNPKPGAAQKSCAIHNAKERANEYGYCYDGETMRPAAIYTRKFQRAGEAAFRQRDLWII